MRRLAKDTTRPYAVATTSPPRHGGRDGAAGPTVRRRLTPLSMRRRLGSAAAPRFYGLSRSDHAGLRGCRAAVQSRCQAAPPPAFRWSTTRLPPPGRTPRAAAAAASASYLLRTPAGCAARCPPPGAAAGGGWCTQNGATRCEAPPAACPERAPAQRTAVPESAW
eukprot:366528-Chlamydomonas_euryale.AAC.15